MMSHSTMCSCWCVICPNTLWHIQVTTKEAGPIAQLVWKTSCQFGVPAIIVSDNGAEFVNWVIAALTKLHGIDHRLISAYRPQANGQVVRYNRVLLSVLRKLSGSTPDRWTDWLDFAMMAIRTAVNATTGFSPFSLMFGREFRPFADYTIMNWGQHHEAEGPLVVSALVDLTQHLRQRLDWQASARVSMRQAQQRQQHGQDEANSVVHTRLRAGSHVYIREIHPDYKLAWRYIGPFVVQGDAVSSTMTSDVMGSANYILADTQGVRLQKSFPRDQLFAVAHPSAELSVRQQFLYGTEEVAAAVGASSSARPGPMRELREDAGEVGKGDFYAVQSLLDERNEKGVPMVLIKWVGYEQADWIKACDVLPDDLHRLRSEKALREHVQRGRLGARQ